MRGFFAGSGSGALGEACVVAEIVAFALKGMPGMAKHAKPRVLYIGTATYDAADARKRQTGCFEAMGCEVESLDVASMGGENTPTEEDMRLSTERADIVLVSGGNTLWAVDRWRSVGLDRHLRAACDRGAVLAGGSAGAICWFDAGHSDSMDPTSYFRPKDRIPSSEWSYIRCPCLGFLPGLVCPHYDKVQSNGVLRANDFDDMLLRHSSERGVGIDHWAVSKKYAVLTFNLVLILIACFCFIGAYH